MKVINLSPDDLVLGEGKDSDFPSVGEATVTRKLVKVGNIFGPNDYAPLYFEESLGVENLPDPQEGAIYVVSREVAQALPDREDLVFPALTGLRPDGRRWVKDFATVSRKPAPPAPDDPALYTKGMGGLPGGTDGALGRGREGGSGYISSSEHRRRIMAGRKL